MEQMTISGFEDQNLTIKASRLTEAIKEYMKEIPSMKDYTSYVAAEVNKGFISVKAKGLVAARITERGKGTAVEFSKEYNSLFSGYEIQDSNDRNSKIILQAFDEVLGMANIFVQIANRILPWGTGIACCSKYIECSDKEYCVQPDRELSMGCKYRQNLYSGRIFYGKNKNV